MFYNIFMIFKNIMEYSRILWNVLEYSKYLVISNNIIIMVIHHMCYLFMVIVLMVGGWSQD